ncbi:MAG: outer membrane protein assembly factor BamD [Halothiobacillaceae bacterium]|nr:outer membrane protein assembly factor BamD [Halothiobacillaceae bacterium]
MFRRTLALFSVFVLLAVTAGCSWFQGKDEDTLEKEAANTPAVDLYAKASRALKTGDYEGAIQGFETLEARYPFGSYSEQAKLEAAYAYYKYGEQESAIATVDRYLQLHPRGENVDYALYLKGLANLKRGSSLTDDYVRQRDHSRRDQGALQQAYSSFSELVRRFPQSKYAEESQQRLLEIRNLMAEHELYVAQYYMKRGAWLAAANRAQNLLERYNGAPTMPDALKIMVQAYTRLGLTDLAADSRKILELNYPDVAKTLN